MKDGIYLSENCINNLTCNFTNYINKYILNVKYVYSVNNGDALWHTNHKDNLRKHGSDTYGHIKILNNQFLYNGLIKHK